MAFFPCIYFENIQMLYFSLDSLNNRHKTISERIKDAIERLHKRTFFHELLYKLLAVTEFSYFTGTYGVGHPLCRPCHECHRNNSAEFLAEAIFSTFKTVVHSDNNLTNYPKETKELLKLCKRACDRIAKEIK